MFRSDNDAIWLAEDWNPALLRNAWEGISYRLTEYLTAPCQASLLAKVPSRLPQEANFILSSYQKLDPQCEHARDKCRWPE